MNEINEYFKKKTENLSFIEIKPNSYVEINSYKIGEDTPLPLITEELIKEIKDRKAQEEIKISSIINGIIYTIGVDPDFKYAKKYIETLYNYDKNIEQYILFKGLKLIDEGAFEDGMVYFRALVNINDKKSSKMIYKKEKIEIPLLDYLDYIVDYIKEK